MSEALGNLDPNDPLAVFLTKQRAEAERLNRIHARAIENQRRVHAAEAWAHEQPCVCSSPLDECPKHRLLAILTGDWA